MSDDDTSETVLKAALKRGIDGKDALELAQDVERARSKRPVARLKKYLIEQLVKHIKKAIALLLGAAIMLLTIYLTHLTLRRTENE